MQEMQETRVWCLGLEDLLEEEMATHSSILAWKIPWTEEPVAMVHGVAQSRTRLRDGAWTFVWRIGKSCVWELPFGDEHTSILPAAENAIFVFPP